MALGNLLPDSLPLIGVSPEISHNAGIASNLAVKYPAVGLGILTHLYTDNITHCGEIEDCGTYVNSYALKQGAIWQKRSEGRYDDLLRRIGGKSVPYILHIVIEIAFDVLVAADRELIDLITHTWAQAWKQPQELLIEIARAFEMEADDFIGNLRKFRPGNRPDPDAIYSREARAGLFLHKFEPDLRAGDQFRDEDRRRVMEMIELGENVVRDEIPLFIRDCAQRILDHNHEMGRFINGLSLSR